MRKTSAHRLARKIRELGAPAGYEAAVFWFHEDRDRPDRYYIRVARRWPFAGADLTLLELAEARRYLDQLQREIPAQEPAR